MFPSTATTSPGLIALRLMADRAFVGLLWLFTLVGFGVASLTGMNAWLAGGICGVSAMIATAMVATAPGALGTRIIIAVGLMNAYDAMIYVTTGTPWQIDVHMLYFVLSSLLLVYFCWQTLVVAALHTAIQHFAMNLLLPEYLFSEGTDWIRFGFHAVVVVMQLAGTYTIALRGHRMFAQSDELVQEVQVAAAASAQLRAQQDGDRERATHERRATMHRLAASFEGDVAGVVNEVASAASELGTTSQSMTMLAGQARVRSEAASKAAELAAENVQNVTASAEELSASIIEIGQQAELADQTAQAAIENVDRTNGIFRALNNATGQIGKIVEFISGVANQTNLLAINAAIEAARAGEAGKGFVVVAREVKILAEQTAQATTNISAEVREVQNGTKEALRAIEEITTIVGQIGEFSKTISLQVAQQREATGRIAHNIEEASVRTREVVDNINHVAAVSRDADSAAHRARQESQGLGQVSGALGVAASTFVANVRSSGNEESPVDTAPRHLSRAA